MNNEALIENIERHLNAIDLCLKNHLRMPALILIYSGIDIFAALGRPAKKEFSTRKDFIEWCDRYMLQISGLSCSAIDLYAARCGIVHTYTMHSNLSKDGTAKEIIYSWGSQAPDPLQEVINMIGKPVYVIHIETLASKFKIGVMEFVSEVYKDQERLNLVLSRSSKLFKEQPKEFWR
jgi:hypothetical protein